MTDMFDIGRTDGLGQVAVTVTNWAQLTDDDLLVATPLESMFAPGYCHGVEPRAGPTAL